MFTNRTIKSETIKVAQIPPPAIMANAVRNGRFIFLAYRDKEGKWRHYWTDELLSGPVMVLS